MSPPSNSQYNRPTGKDRVGFEARRVAARLLGLVVDEHLSLNGLCDATSGHSTYRALIAKDRSLVRAIAIVSLRHRGQILAVMKKAMDRPEPKRARDLTHALHVAAAQVLFMDIPDSAAVNLGVAMVAENPKTGRFKGFANAVLRRVTREKEQLLEATIPNAPVFSDWFSKRLRTDYGKQKAAAISRMVLHEPRLDISLTDVNSQKEWAEKLDAELLPTGALRLSDRGRVDQLPGFDERAWWVQNVAASVPAKLLGEVSGLQIADLCAAPGGKTAQLAAAGANVTAVDLVQSRLDRLQSNMDRLGLKVETHCADLLEWQPEKTFDGILLDAPCSSTGTVRRHPDVMWSKQNSDVEYLAKLQLQLVKRAVDWVKPGGLLVFATCSMFKQEGEDVFAQLLKDDKRLENVAITAQDVGGLEETINGQGAFRSLPMHLGREPEAAGGMDGFYAARMRRIS